MNGRLLISILKFIEISYKKYWKTKIEKFSKSNWRMNEIRLKNKQKNSQRECHEGVTKMIGFISKNLFVKFSIFSGFPLRETTTSIVDWVEQLSKMDEYIRPFCTYLLWFQFYMPLPFLKYWKEKTKTIISCISSDFYSQSFLYK